MLDEYRIIGIVGLPRQGKSLLAVHYCYTYFKKFNLDVYSNIWLSFRKEKLTIQMLYDFPDEFNNSVIFIDEIHMWADAYKFFDKNSMALSTLFTQLGKRNIIMIFTTQEIRQIPARLRRLMDNVLLTKKYKIYDKKGELIKGLSKVTVYDAQGFVGENEIGQFYFDGRKYFDMYDTKEIVRGA